MAVEGIENSSETAISTVDQKNIPDIMKLYPQSIAVTAENIAVMEQLVTTVLEKEVDYGQHPGTSSMALRDPGASKINNAFNTFPEHTILHSIEDDEVISYLIQVRLIARKTGQVVATGVGACSTLETKYSFRWVYYPMQWGYTKDQLAGLKTRERDGRTQYRIDNPDLQDLGNTILKMAAKRAEIDACQNLPGVGSALRKLFDPNLAKGLPDEPDYGHFWGMVKNMGINEKNAHSILGVESMKEWVGSGKTLEEAIVAIGKYLTELLRKTTSGKPDKKQGKPEAEIDESVTLATITENHIPTNDHLEAYAGKFFGLAAGELYRELGYKDRAAFEAAKVEKPWQAFLSIKSLREKPPEETTDTDNEDLPF